MDKCNYCGAVESEIAILFRCICADCYSAVPFEIRRKIIEDAAEQIEAPTYSIK